MPPGGAPLKMKGGEGGRQDSCEVDIRIPLQGSSSSLHLKGKGHAMPNQSLQYLKIINEHIFSWNKTNEVSEAANDLT